MVFISSWEIIDIIFMVAAAGFIFMALLPRIFKRGVIAQYQSFFTWDKFWTACLIAGPAIVLHEFGHKIAAVSFGLNATLHAPYTWLLFAVILVLFRAPIIFFVGGYVSIIGIATPLQNVIISFAGPFVNLLLWLIPLYILSNKEMLSKMKKKTIEILYFTKMINMFLFIFNMLPIPGFDGFHFFSGLFQLLF